MSHLPAILPLEGVSFETAVCALSSETGFIAVDNVQERYLIVASYPKRTISFTGAFVSIDGHTVIDSPREALNNFFSSVDELPSDPYLPFCGGAIGYIGFEGAKVLRGFDPAKGFSRYPQCRFGIYLNPVIFDHIERTAFIVSRDHSSANILKERLENAPKWNKKQISNFDTDDNVRLTPDDGEFKKLVNEAHLWLRSECADRIHLVRHTTSPETGITPPENFLSHRCHGTVQAIFSHEGAFAILGSDDQLIELSGKNVWSRAIEELIPFLPSPSVIGEPLERAMTFISEYDEEHRQFYGGTFGFFDSTRGVFRTITHSMNYADGAVSLTSGADINADTDLVAINNQIKSSLDKQVIRSVSLR